MSPRFILVATLACLALVSAKPFAGYHPEQLDALNRLYTSTNGSTWRNKNEWTNDLYCLRYGVVCDGQRNVISLYPHAGLRLWFQIDLVSELSARLLSVFLSR